MFDDDEVDAPDECLCTPFRGCTDKLITQFWKDVRVEPIGAQPEHMENTDDNTMLEGDLRDDDAGLLVPVRRVGRWSHLIIKKVAGLSRTPMRYPLSRVQR